MREVTEIEGWLGVRPVEFLLGIGIGPRWCLVHATQMTGDETERLARSGAVAGLCPITEANLGDGVFNGPEFLAAGGAFGIGSDSNVRIGLAEELRSLEYSQRLTHRARNVLAAPGASVGATLHAAALAGGARALGRECGAVRPGALADLVAIDRGDVTLAALDDGPAARRLDLRRRRPGGARGLVGGAPRGARRPACRARGGGGALPGRAGRHLARI